MSSPRKTVAARREQGQFASRLAEAGTHLALLALSSFPFTAAFPNPLVESGIAPLAFIALVPIFPVIRRSGWIGIWLYGIFYGFATYALFNYWLANFHPLAIFIVPTIYAGYFFVVFPLLKLADRKSVV